MGAPRTILLTGGNRGLGLATSSRLLGLGHRVIFTARDPARGEAALRELRGRHPGAQVELRALDLASRASIDAFSQSLVREVPSLDVLFHNAGVMQQSPTRRVTVDGFEETLAVNALAPFVLTHHLLPLLARGASPRVVLVSSRLHLPGSRGAPVRFDFDDPDLTRGYHPERAYKNSKLAVIWLTRELARRLEPQDITANAVCPGFVPVTAAESVTGAMRLFMKHVLRRMPFATSVEEASRRFAEMATSPALDGVRGLFYADGAPMAPSACALDDDKARRFWALCLTLTGLDDWP